MIDIPTIRRAAEADCDRIIALYDELDAFHRAARPDLFRIADGPARAPDAICGLIRGPDSAIFVAEQDGMLLGLSLIHARRLAPLGIRPARAYAEIDSFGLTASARGQGIGQLLMRASEDWARAMGLPKIELQVHAFNRGAIDFYEAGGFAPMLHRMERTLG